MFKKLSANTPGFKMVCATIHGGTVITAVGTDASAVAPVYVSAFAPDSESASGCVNAFESKIQTNKFENFVVDRLSMSNHHAVGQPRKHGQLRIRNQLCA